MSFGLSRPTLNPASIGALSGKNGALVGLVACGKAKAPRRCPARELYTGSLTAMSVAWAVRNFSEWYILSAKFGLLHPDKEVRPYERTLNDMDESSRAEWSACVTKQILAKGLNDRTFVVLAGGLYEELLVFPPARKVVLMRGLKMGYRMKWLKDNPVLTQAIFDAARN